MPILDNCKRYYPVHNTLNVVFVVKHFQVASRSICLYINQLHTYIDTLRM